MSATARLAAFGACFLWAVSFVATKEALLAVPPLTVVTLRLIIAAVCFGVWLAVDRRPMKHEGGSWARLGVGDWLRLAALSTVGTGLHYGSQTIGLQYTTASNASLYAVTAPITIVVLAAIFLGEPVGVKKTGGIVVAVLGVLTVMGWDTVIHLELTAHVVGDLLVVSSIVMWGVFTVFGKRSADRLGALHLSAAVTIIGALWMVPVGWVEAAKLDLVWGTIPASAWAAIGFLGAGCCFLATLLYFIALERSESQKVGVYLYTIPPMTAVVAAVHLGEALTPAFFVGSILVFAGVILTERG